MRLQVPESRRARAAAYRAAARIARGVHDASENGTVTSIAVRHASTVAMHAMLDTPSRETALDALVSARRALSLMRATRHDAVVDGTPDSSLDGLPGGWPGGWLGERLSRLIEDCRAQSLSDDEPCDESCDEPRDAGSSDSFDGPSVPHLDPRTGPSDARRPRGTRRRPEPS